jgi:hypothetical protein
MALINRTTGSALIDGLNSFWLRFFNDTAVIDKLYSATEVLLGDTYLDLMEAVLSKSLRNTPVFSKRDWQLLVLSNTNLSFDPAIFSSDSTTALGPAITITALELAATHDNTSLELADRFNLSLEEKEKFPSHGIYNLGLVNDIVNHEKLWIAVVPDNKTLKESIEALDKRVITNKRIEDFVIEQKPSAQSIDVSVRDLLAYQGTWDAATNTPAIPPADSMNKGHYYEVSVAGFTNIDGISSWAVGDWIVSNGTAWEKAPLEDPVFTFRYGDVVTDPITLAPGNYTDLDGIKTAVQNAIDTTSAGMTIDLNITVAVDGAHLIFTSDKSLTVWSANTAAECQLWLKPFKFKVTAAVPPGREDEFLWTQTSPIQLITSGYREAGTEYRFPIDTNIKSALYIFNTLISPSLSLEQGREYRIQDGFIYFKDNPFEFDNVAFRDFGDGRVELALWLSSVSRDLLTLYTHYGYRYTGLKASSQGYKDLIQGIYYFYTHGPQLERLRSAFNILAGIPVVKENDEIVLSVTATEVVTDKNTYTFSAETPPVVVPGQTLQAFDAMTDAFLVEDYISNPSWYDQILIPESLIPGVSNNFRISTLTTFIPNVGDAGFIVGDTPTDGLRFVTNPIEPDGGDYSISSDAFFIIEKDENGREFKIVVPPSLTVGATSLDDMIAYLRIALKQIVGVAVDGAGGNVFRLYSDATFTITHNAISYDITVTPADTAAVNTLADLAAVLQGILDTEMGSGKVTVSPYLAGNSLIIMPTSVVNISLSNLNVSASSELGFFPFNSLTGIVLSKEDNSVVFESSTVGSTSRVNISDMNPSALDNFEMEPFRQGSGDFVGIDGDPSTGYEIMDTYLKFNTFRIRYNAGAVSFEPDTVTIQEIAIQGRPLYTFPFIQPEFDLSDSVVGSGDDTITDPDAFLAKISPDDILLVDVQAKKKITVYASEPQGSYYRKRSDGSEVYDLIADPRGQYVFEDASTDGGEIHVISTLPGLVEHDHLVEVINVGDLKVEDTAYFSSVGVYNRGIILNGIDIPIQVIPSGTLGGIYPADVFGNSYGHWVPGFDKADFPAAATHVFVIDDAMKLAGFDPFEEGVVAGHFMILNNMADEFNNGEFGILHYYRNIHYRGQYSGSNKVLVDLLVYRNNVSTTTTDENYADSTIPPAATIRFRRGGTTQNKSWLIVLPDTGLMSDRIDAVNAVTDDNKDVFPFDVSYVPAAIDNQTWNPPPVGEYYEGLTHDGDPLQESFYGELHAAYYGIEFEPGDPDAQPLNPTPSGSVPPGTVPDYFTVDTMAGNVTLGNTWGVETYTYDPDEPGQVSRDSGALTNPYLLGLEAGVPLYADYDAASKLDLEGVIQYGEVTFWKGIQYHFTNLAPTDKAEYYGAEYNNIVAPLSTGPTVWPPGDTSTYRSYNWRGYWISRFDCLGTYDSSDPNKLLIGGGSPPATPAPPGYTIGEGTSLWTLEIGRTLCCIPGSSLPAPGTGNENDLYTVLWSSNVPQPGVIAPAEPGYNLFEHLDWIYSDGTNWIRERHFGTTAEVTPFNLGRRFFDTIDAGIHQDFEYVWLIGAGEILCNGSSHNYLIGVDGTSWTRVIGARVSGNMSSGGYYDYMGPSWLKGYGPQILTNHSVETTLAETENSSVLDWSQDTTFPGPHYPFLRMYAPGGSNFTLYMQVPDSALFEEGLVISKVPGISVSSVPDAIRLLYYDNRVSSWATPTLAQIDGSLVTSDDFTLKIAETALYAHDLRLWNGNEANYLNVTPDGQSGLVDQDLVINRLTGFIVIAIKINYGGTLGVLTDYLEGIAIERSRIVVEAA